MNYLVVDTETTWKRKLMTAGALVFNENFEVVDNFYEMSVGAYRQGGYYKDQVYNSLLDPVQASTSEILDDILELYEKHNCKGIFAYNAQFDKGLLTTLPSDEWYDIMKIAAYKQNNPFLTDEFEYCATGRLKKNYNVEFMYKLLSGKESYKEIHNAYQDAVDELELMRMLKIPIEKYKVAKI